MKSFKSTLIFVAFVTLQATVEGQFENDQFIVGGIPADIANFPHQLALLDMVRGVMPTGYM